MTHVTHPKSDPFDPLIHDPSAHCLALVIMATIGMIRYLTTNAAAKLQSAPDANN